MKAGSWSPAAIEETAKLVSLAFAALVAIGLLVKAAGGFTTVAIVFAAIGVVGALVALMLGGLQRSAKSRAEREALWVRPPAQVEELAAGDGIYTLGVETEAPDALEAAGLRDHAHAPYVPRDIDQPLMERLRAAAAREAVAVIVVSGVSRRQVSRGHCFEL